MKVQYYLLFALTALGIFHKLFHLISSKTQWCKYCYKLPFCKWKHWAWWSLMTCPRYIDNKWKHLESDSGSLALELTLSITMCPTGCGGQYSDPRALRMLYRHLMNVRWMNDTNKGVSEQVNIQPTCKEKKRSVWDTSCWWDLSSQILNQNNLIKTKLCMVTIRSSIFKILNQNAWFSRNTM